MDNVYLEFFRRNFVDIQTITLNWEYEESNERFSHRRHYVDPDDHIDVKELDDCFLFTLKSTIDISTNEFENTFIVVKDLPSISRYNKLRNNEELRTLISNREDIRNNFSCFLYEGEPNGNFTRKSNESDFGLYDGIFFFRKPLENENIFISSLRAEYDLPSGEIIL